VGHSNGGRIAIRMAATEPRRAARLVLVDSAGIRPKRTLRYYRRVGMAKVGKYAARYLGAPGERLRARIVGRVASSDYAAAGEMRPTLVRLVNSDLREYLPRISAPTLLVWGAEDTDTPLADAHLMEKLIPDSGLVVLDGAGHYSYLDQSARFARIVTHFIAPPAAAAPSAAANSAEPSAAPNPAAPPAAADPVVPPAAADIPAPFGTSSASVAEQGPAPAQAPARSQRPPSGAGPA
jgi:alpha-beta hydrolase superfamily lysophospholipase